MSASSPLSFESLRNELKQRRLFADPRDGEVELLRHVSGFVAGDLDAEAELLTRLAAGTADARELWQIDLHATNRLVEVAGHAGLARVRERERLCEHEAFGSLPDSRAFAPGSEGYWSWHDAGSRTVVGSEPEEPGSDPRERPSRQVEFPEAFAIARVPVTNELFGAFRRDWQFAPECADHPVVEVSWYDAWLFARWAGARLPSESEWECAARAGAVIDTESTMPRGRGTRSVLSDDPDRCGVYAMVGNVWQWCMDAWSETLAELPVDGTAVPTPIMNALPQRARRGGAWVSKPARRRVAAREGDAADARLPFVGFRLATSSRDVGRCAVMQP